MYNTVKEGITAFNGLQSGCRVGGRMLTAYANHIEYYYNALMGTSGTPIPFVESINESEEINVDNDTVFEDVVTNTNPRAARSNYGKNSNSSTKTEKGTLLIGIGL